MRPGTPGPWRWLSGNDLVGDHGRRPAVLTSSRDRGGVPILRQQVDGRLEQFDPTSADARLIAAAPDLLEALTALLDTAGEPNEDIKFAARAAIRKATGVAPTGAGSRP